MLDGLEEQRPLSIIERNLRKQLKTRDGDGVGLGRVDQKPVPPQKAAGWKMTSTPAPVGEKLHPHPVGFGCPRVLVEKKEIQSNEYRC
jgi:hypothetical protein